MNQLIKKVVIIVKVNKQLLQKLLILMLQLKILVERLERLMNLNPKQSQIVIQQFRVLLKKKLIWEAMETKVFSQHIKTINKV